MPLDSQYHLIHTYKTIELMIEFKFSSNEEIFFQLLELKVFHIRSLGHKQTALVCDSQIIDPPN